MMMMMMVVVVRGSRGVPVFVLLQRPHHTKPAGRSPDHLSDSHETFTANISLSTLVFSLFNSKI